MRIPLGIFLLGATASAHAQSVGGSGLAAGGLSGVGMGAFGGVMIARVNVAPYGGGFGFQGGGVGVQGGFGGAGGGSGGGGGLFGVTRPSLMAERNAMAAQFFSSGGVNVPAQVLPGSAGQVGGGVYFGGRTQNSSSVGQVATTQRAAVEPAAAIAGPAMPFAPPPTMARQPETPNPAAAALAGTDSRPVGAGSAATASANSRSRLGSPLPWPNRATASAQASRAMATAGFPGRRGR